MTSLLLALTAALSYGFSDFVGGVASRKTHVLHVVLVSYPISVVLVLMIAPFAGGVADITSLSWGAVSGVAGGLAVLWFYAAMASGPMNVVSPVTALLSAALPLLAGLVGGEQPGSIALVGTVFAVVAVVLVSREERGPVDETEVTRFTPKVMVLTAGAGTMFALYFTLLHQVPGGSGLWPVLVSRVAASLTVFVPALFAHRVQLARGGAAWLAFMAGGLDVVASVTMLYALQSGMLSLVSVLASLYPGATVLMARLVLGERSTVVQKVGLVLAGVSVGLIASAS